MHLRPQYAGAKAEVSGKRARHRPARSAARPCVLASVAGQLGAGWLLKWAWPANAGASSPSRLLSCGKLVGRKEAAIIA